MGKYGHSTYRPSWPEVLKYRDEKECRTKSSTWNSATSHRSSNNNGCCLKLKAFIKIKKFQYYSKTPNKCFKVKDVEELKTKYNFTEEDLQEKER